MQQGVGRHVHRAVLSGRRERRSGGRPHRVRCAAGKGAVQSSLAACGLPGEALPGVAIV